MATGYQGRDNHWQGTFEDAYEALAAAILRRAVLDLEAVQVRQTPWTLECAYDAIWYLRGDEGRGLICALGLAHTPFDEAIERTLKAAPEITDHMLATPEVMGKWLNVS